MHCLTDIMYKTYNSHNNKCPAHSNSRYFACLINSGLARGLALYPRNLKKVNLVSSLMSRKRLRSNEEEDDFEEPCPKRTRELMWRVPDDMDTQVGV